MITNPSFLVTAVLGLTSSVSAFLPSPHGRNARFPHRSSQTTTSTAMKVESAQMLEFREPTTGVNVKLIGSMHYNPSSVKLVEDTITELGEAGQLGSVVIELCDTRWNSTDEQPAFIKKILRSEMKAAYEYALTYGRPVVLGDQNIETTLSRAGDGLWETFKSLWDPYDGWPALYANLTEAFAVTSPTGEGYLGPGAFFSPPFLLRAPVALVKYPLSYAVRSPLVFAAFVTISAISDSANAAATSSAMMTATAGGTDAVTAAAAAATSYSGDLVDMSLSWLVFFLENLLFARIFLKEFLADRNEVLAKNILDQCRLYQKKNFLSSVLPGGKRPDADTIYAEDTLKGNSRSGGGGNAEKSIVVVVGMAHSNGVKKLLSEQLVS
uniref:Uncharacterized protein n=1 Tax=Grammatophora oceanica TaxID=210454 RepID=A0A7S1VMY0_9STRA|mmetsp:Transcript_51051/g.76291  ORF Transcript_51051/g.76291 Transcript_51051/m.76291 type:complete len:382 (+) Transcript_51051:165-1310(+)|eukprot:CAMPEP_0194046438 /NCGR_PEP_ID=MMETSP0009_2-20130614/21107_1 /TAXON_ID=210454 /ORGANISM="Grammatophora oceanica, Strain CCMP 410" /LENGTH=381 /DNA_ID=CAMNT_0038691725 /DNA_START=124 /DNA_END=1269 /DNA_ORIENTATION=+